MPDEVTGPHRTKAPEPQACVHASEESHGYHDLIYCLYPGCQSQGFRRGRDLEEHYKSAHIQTTPRQIPTALDPFDRLEVFLESLQKSADLEKTVDEESNKSANSIKTPIKRSRQAGWRWRCARCSQIVDLDCYGYVCPVCRQT